MKKDSSIKLPANKKASDEEAFKNFKLTTAQRMFLIIASDCGGSIRKACLKARLSRTIIWQWGNDNPAFKQAQLTLKETMVDLAEEGMTVLLKKKNLGAIIFTLKCFGRERGWVEHVEMDMGQIRNEARKLAREVADVVAEEVKDPKQRANARERISNVFARFG